jgi:hypothetical protein
MTQEKMVACAMCGERPSRRDGWFLLAESQWQDRLKILHWNDGLAAQPGIRCACSAIHVEQLVVHWMTAGSLDHPFARLPQGKHLPLKSRHRLGSEVDTSGVRMIGELAVDRESLQRVLKENPQSLSAILEALLSAMRRETEGGAAALECQELELCHTYREI